MKASELTEAPYLHVGEMPRRLLDGGVSISAINREYHQIGEVENLPVYMDGHNSHSIVIDPQQSVGPDRLLQVFRVQFKPNHQLKFTNTFRNVLQISKVAIDRQYGVRGIASQVYNLLVDNGYTLVSDDTQFEPAQSLWKRLAASGDYPVYVADVEHGLFKDANGLPIVYNGSNIPDSDIWSSGSDFNGQYRVMILSGK